MKISAPDVSSPDAETIIKMAADEFFSRKKLKKIGYRSSKDIVRNVVVNRDDVNIEVSVGSNGGADEVGGERDKGNEDKDRDRDKVNEDEDKSEVHEDEDRNEVNEVEEIEAIAHRLKLPDVGDTGFSDNSGIENDEEFDTFEEF